MVCGLRSRVYSDVRFKVYGLGFRACNCRLSGQQVESSLRPFGGALSDDTGAPTATMKALSESHDSHRAFGFGREGTGGRASQCSFCILGI